MDELSLDGLDIDGLIEFGLIGYEFNLDGLDLFWIQLIYKDFFGLIWVGSLIEYLFFKVCLDILLYGFKSREEYLDTLSLGHSI